LGRAGLPRNGFNKQTRELGMRVGLSLTGTGRKEKGQGGGGEDEKFSKPASADLRSREDHITQNLKNNTRDEDGYCFT